MALLPLLTVSLHAATTIQHDTAVYVNELQSGTSTSLSSQTSSTGQRISATSGAFSSEAFVDQVTSNTAPTLRVKAGGSTTAYTDPNRSMQATAVAQTSTIFTATSATQPFETSFAAGFNFTIDGFINFDVANPLGTEFSPFRPGDQGRISFNLLIRPESDEYASAASTISVGSEIYWNSTGINFGDTTIYDGNSNPIGGAGINSTTISPTQESFTVTANTPFSALVGVEYRMEAYFQSDVSIRGGTGSKAVEVDFFNSMNASPVAADDESGFGFTTVPEPSSTALLGLGSLALMLRRRR